MAFYEDWDIFTKIESLINDENDKILLAHGDPGKNDLIILNLGIGKSSAFAAYGQLHHKRRHCFEEKQHSSGWEVRYACKLGDI